MRPLTVEWGTLALTLRRHLSLRYHLRRVEECGIEAGWKRTVSCDRRGSSYRGSVKNFNTSSYRMSLWPFDFTAATRTNQFLRSRGARLYSARVFAKKAHQSSWNRSGRCDLGRRFGRQGLSRSLWVSPRHRGLWSELTSRTAQYYLTNKSCLCVTPSSVIRLYSTEYLLSLRARRLCRIHSPEFETLSHRLLG